MESHLSDNLLFESVHHVDVCYISNVKYSNGTFSQTIIYSIYIYIFVYIEYTLGLKQNTTNT